MLLKCDSAEKNCLHRITNWRRSLARVSYKVLPSKLFEWLVTLEEWFATMSQTFRSAEHRPLDTQRVAGYYPRKC